MSQILLVEDDADLGTALEAYLELKGFSVIRVLDGEAALEAIKEQVPKLCILDVMMPKMDGFTLAEHMVETHPDLPFLFLTARSLKADQLKGFQLGADDYLTKPVDEELLVARIHAILRRSGTQKIEITREMKIGHFTFEPTTRQLTSTDSEQRLTEKEAGLLVMLLQKQGQILSREEALTQLWGGIDYFKRKSMDVYITKLRAHLSSDSNLSIDNVHGKGFVLRGRDS